MSKTQRIVRAGLQGIVLGLGFLAYMCLFILGAEKWRGWFAIPFLILSLGAAFAVIEWRFGQTPHQDEAA
ncbi:MAG: hypothetical protein ACTHMK_13825 [Dyella sp.]|uniref:hypothetical protein n=1 Tax=Dyella sp. TaxID=1869338 RepID=UPI003F7E4C8E